MTIVEFGFNDSSTLLSFINGINIPALYKAIDEDKSIVADLIDLDVTWDSETKKWYYTINNNNIRIHDDNTEEVIGIHTIINCSNIKTIRFIEISNDEFHDVKNPYIPSKEKEKDT